MGDGWVGVEWLCKQAWAMRSNGLQLWREWCAGVPPVSAGANIHYLILNLMSLNIYKLNLNQLLIRVVYLYI